MSDISRFNTDLASHQQAIRDKCFHPTGVYDEFDRSKIEKSVPERLRQMTEAYPDRLAVKCKDYQFTYAEFHEEANRLANVILNELGEGQEAVTLMFGHDEQMIMAIFAVLKTGKFHVPLNPSYPRARNTFVVEDSQTRLIITSNRYLSLANELAGNGIRLINIDKLSPEMSAETPGVTISPDDFAYIVYTSGTTGQPKGVIENHRNVVHFSMLYNSNLHVCPEDRLSVLDAFSFSGSASQLYPALLNGASSFPFDLKSEGLSNFADFMANEEITVCGLVPTAFRSLAGSLTGENNLPELRVLAVGGDRVDMTVVEPYRKYLAPHCILRNGFGSSEVKEIAWFLIDKETQLINNTVPVGYALEYIELLLLDDNEMPVGPDQVGEIAIKSRYISPGYWRRPDLSQAKFRPDPNEGNERIYLTGDVGQMSPDGCMFHLGRKDFQAKIRGYRIEVDEIETAILDIKNVKEAAVIAQYLFDGEKRLAAYIVPEKQPAPTVSVLRRVLSERLPDYMIPSIYVFIDALPLNVNGKVDRLALPKPDLRRPELDDAYVPPTTKLEIILVDLWQETLGIEPVGIHDHFLDLGGDSIRGMIFLNRLQEKLDDIFHVSALFDAPTIAEFAEYLAEYYPQAEPRLAGEASETIATPQLDRVSESEVAEFRKNTLISLMRHSAALWPASRKNPSAIFVLSPPRSGSTLFRVLLAGHPRLFSPPELNMLDYGTLTERKATLTGRLSSATQGFLRAIMALMDCSVEEAHNLMAKYEEQNLTIQRLYGLIQEQLDGKVLVDKSPNYTYLVETLRNAESWFNEPYYIHLLRHPYGMILSYEESRLDRIFPVDNDYHPRKLAELIWLTSQQNTIEFLRDIPTHRQHRVKFEDLVADPQSAMEKVCRFLNLDFYPDMLKPYENKHEKMTDGIYSASRMIGDVKFHNHRKIEPGVANRWRTAYFHDFLGDITWQMAESLGYERPDDPDSLFGEVDIEQTLTDLEVMSDEEAKKLLAKEGRD